MLKCNGMCYQEVECLSKEEQAEGNSRVKQSLFLNCRKDVCLVVRPPLLQLVLILCLQRPGALPWETQILGGGNRQLWECRGRATNQNRTQSSRGG